MKCAHCALFIAIALVASTQGTGQQFPMSNGGCTVSRSGAESCEWLSAVNISDLNSPSRHTYKQQHELELVVTKVSLAPGAPLDRPVDEYDIVIVAINKGKLRNEAKEAEQLFLVDAQQTFLMLRNQPFLLRNTGDEELKLLVIELRTGTITPSTEK